MAKFGTDQIHNVAVLGHGGSGKTTIAEALIFRTGATNRMGRVEDGSTISDWDAEEQRRGISINLSVVPFETATARINLIDTPGYVDFVGEVNAALHVAEAGLVLVDAVAGVEVGTELAWDRLRDLEKPTHLFRQPHGARECRLRQGRRESDRDLPGRQHRAVSDADWPGRRFPGCHQPGKHEGVSRTGRQRRRHSRRNWPKRRKRPLGV